MTLLEFKKWCYERHDVFCNQKYDDLPYSFHLKAVLAQTKKYEKLFVSSGNKTFEDSYKIFCTQAAAVGHDLIEDARVSYNDIKNMMGEQVAEIIFLLTENKGRNRKERHDNAYWEGVLSNSEASFVKLCDILANTLYSKLTGSSMIKRYKEELSVLDRFPAEFGPIIEDIKRLHL